MSAECGTLVLVSSTHKFLDDGRSRRPGGRRSPRLLPSGPASGGRMEDSTVRKMIARSATTKAAFLRDRQARWDRKHRHKYQCTVSDRHHALLQAMCRRYGISQYRLVKHLLMEALEYEVYDTIAAAVASTENGRRALSEMLTGRNYPTRSLEPPGGTPPRQLPGIDRPGDKPRGDDHSGG